VTPGDGSAGVRRRLVVEADGGSRGNPGPAAYGTVVREGATGEVLVELAEHIGTASNNVAEYRGVIAGLTAAHEIDPDADVDVRLDSKLIVEQLSGRWQVKHPDMRVLAKQALAVWPPGRVTYTWVPREQNRAADRLVNEALDLAARGRPWTPRLEQVSATQAADELEDAPPNRLVGWAHDLGEPTTLVLLRHGETVHTRAKRFSGSGGDDPPLSDDGAAQARAAGDRLATVLGMGPDAVSVVVTSPLQRARQTAAVVSDLLGVPLEVDDGLAECDFGAWEGLTFAEVEEGWPDELAAWLASTAVAPPGGESFDDVLVRVRASRDRLLARAHAGTAVVVSHVTPIKTLVLLALEAPARAAYRMELAPASLSTVLWFDDGNASVRSLNDTQHLDGLLPQQHV
jgi:ribonuclease H / adenosylcobalamin/alpha-ribazole phosphatase